jgi:hypothetical protein
MMRAIRGIKVNRMYTGLPADREDWLDQLTYAMHFGTPEEMYNACSAAMHEAEREERPFTRIYWTGEFGAEPVLTMWRV